eukprot:2705317-Pyramimonas_sp.AAC.1
MSYEDMYLCIGVPWWGSLGALLWLPLRGRVCRRCGGIEISHMFRICAFPHRPRCARSCPSSRPRRKSMPSQMQPAGESSSKIQAYARSSRVRLWYQLSGSCCGASWSRTRGR